MKLVKSLYSWIIEIMKRESIKHLGFIYSSRLITAVLRFVASIVVVRTLGPERFGLLTIAAVIMGISGRLIELGMTTTMVRKLSFHISQGDDDKAIGIFKRVYLLRLQISGVFMVIAYFIAPFVAKNIYHDAQLVIPLRLAAGGAFIYNVWYHSEGALRAFEKFKQIAIIGVVSHITRTGLILLLAYFAFLNVESAMLANISQIFIGFIVSSLIIPRMFYKATGVSAYPLKEIVTYSSWMFLFNVVFMLFDRLDVLMLGYFRQAAEVGIYSVAFTLIKPFELIPETFNTVFLPKVSRFTQKSEIFRYFKDTIKVTSLVAVVCIFLVFLAKPLIVTFFGEEYIASVRLFQILVGAFVLLTILNPINLAGHSLNKPQLFAIMAGINLVLNFIGNLIFIPRYGALGAAIVTLISRILGGACGLVVLMYYIQRWKEPD
jgi:O-antigen/teichoic acid export membrane protein